MPVGDKHIRLQKADVNLYSHLLTHKRDMLSATTSHGPTVTTRFSRLSPGQIRKIAFVFEIRPGATFSSKTCMPCRTQLASKTSPAALTMSDSSKSSCSAGAKSPGTRRFTPNPLHHDHEGKSRGRSGIRFKIVSGRPSPLFYKLSPCFR